MSTIYVSNAARTVYIKKILLVAMSKTIVSYNIKI